MTKQYVCLFLDTESKDINYIKASARIRHISKKELFRRVLKTTIEDQMFGAILDDIKWDNNEE